MVGIPGPRLEAVARHLIQDLQVGGIILFKRNIEDLPQVAQLNNELQQLALEATGSPLFIAVDQEGGPVQRLRAPFREVPPARVWGEQDNPPAVEQAAAQMAQELRLLGFNMNLAPVLDVARNPGCPLYERSYGSDPEKVARMGLAFIKGMQQGNIIAVAKHFPGLGNTALDSHQELPAVLDGTEDRENDLYPFHRAIAAGIPAIMSAHVVVPRWDSQPATLSKNILTERLRGKLGFQGLILSDDLEMGAIARHQTVPEAALQALEAGIDQLLICERPEVIEQVHAAMVSDKRMATAMEAALKRISSVKRTLPPSRVEVEAVRSYFSSPDHKLSAQALGDEQGVI